MFLAKRTLRNIKIRPIYLIITVGVECIKTSWFSIREH